VKVGISQLIAPELSMDELFARSSAAGYEVIELSLKREGPLTPQTTENELKRIVGLSKEHRLPIVSMTINHWTGNLLADGEAQRTAIAETLQGIEIARKLGAPNVLHTLGRLSPELYYDDAYRNGVAALKEIARTCEQMDIRLAVEFVWSGFLFSPLEMRRFLDEINSDLIGFYFDPGNMAVFQQPHHWVRIVGNRTFLVHVKDWQGNALNGGWTPLLEGKVDFAAINRELRAMGYAGPLISEVAQSLASLEQTAEAIRKIIKM
jgi:L-ribulose-5-phosphate 3-epimerase